MTAAPITNPITQPEPSSPAVAKPKKGGTMAIRAILLGLLLAPLTAYWSADQGIDTIFSLMIPPVVLTIIVAVANLIVKRIAPKLALNEGGIIIFYGMHTAIGAMCAEWLWTINPYIHSYALYKSNNTRYEKYMLPYAHPWFFIQPQDASKFTDYKNGGFTFQYFWEKLPLWMPFILSWTLLITLVCVAMLCINSLMRDEWTSRERLAFPIIQLPMAIAQAGAGKSSFWKTKFFLIPFFFMFIIDMVNGFHFIYPSLPLINVRFIGDLRQFFQTQPFNSIGWTPIGIFPYMAVIGFFMPTDLLFSCIFFFFFRKAEQVITYAIGYTESAGVFGGGGLVPSAPYFSEQSWGAFLALFCSSCWVARGYLREVWGQIRYGSSKQEDGIPHRFAFAGLLGCLIGLGGIGLMIGIPLWMLAFEVILFLMFSIAMTRMRAQIGAPSHEMAFMGPNQLLVDFVGTQGLPTAGVSRTVMTLHFMNRIHRTHPMPHQLEVMKMGDTAKVSQRAIFIAVILATIVGCFLGHGISIFKGYRFGAQDQAGDTANVVSTLLERHQGPNPYGVLFVFLGFCVVLGLDFIRFTNPGFPLHPAGYALAMNFGLDYFWFGLVIVLVIKVAVEKYYGLKGYDKLHQIALGIITAEFMAEAIWATFSMVTKTATYSVSINGRLGWDQ